MTPFAKNVAEFSIGHKTLWRKKGYDKILQPFPHDVRFFDITEVLDLTRDLGRQAQEKATLAESLAFLPSPATWIEYKPPGGYYNGFLLVERADKKMASIVEMAGTQARDRFGFLTHLKADIPLLENADPDAWAIESTIMFQSALEAGWEKRVPVKDLDQYMLGTQEQAYWLYAILSVINSPKIVARTEHKPQPGLERQLQRQADRRFSLMPWHVIKLDVTEPNSEADVGTVTGRMTGPRALHFCRSFLRIRLGKLERVRAHYRGDAAAGIARASYKVQ